MAKLTSKLQVTIPKRIAEHYGIVPGDEVDFVPAGDVIRLVPPGQSARRKPSFEERRRVFDAATLRQRERERGMGLPAESPAERDWRREDLYDRGKPR